jgi:energy-coupling factor transporter ATP-binding protein EcfA2/SAM-dependent methyltransferase
MIDATGLVLANVESGRDFTFSDLLIAPGQTGLIVWDNRAGRSFLFDALMGASSAVNSSWFIKANIEVGGDRKYLCISNPEIQVSNCFKTAVGELCIPMLTQAVSRSQQVTNADFLAAAFGLPEIFSALVQDYSSGEKQRLLIASTLAADADSIFFDGALDYIDPVARQTIVALISQVARSKGMSCLIGSSAPLKELEGLFDYVLHVDGDRDEDNLLRRCSKPFVCDDRLPSVEIQNLRYAIPGRSNLLYDNLSLQAFTGRGLLIKGPNGSGKSTIGSLLAGVVSPSEGSIKICGEAPNLRRTDHAPRVGFSFSDPDLTLSKATIEREFDATRAGALTSGVFDEIVRILRLGDKLDSSPFDLDWHFRKRVSVAKALKVANPIAFVDEPTVDATLKEKMEIGRVLCSAVEAGLSVIVATNDEELINALPDFEMVALPSPEFLAADHSLNAEQSPKAGSDLWQNAASAWLRNTGEFSLFWAKNIYPTLRKVVSGMDIKTRATVVDIGCGHGLHTAAVARMFADVGGGVLSAVGIDKEERFIDIANSVFASTNGLHFFTADLSRHVLLELETAIAEDEQLIVVSLFSLHDISSLHGLTTYLGKKAEKVIGVIFVLLDPAVVERSYEPTRTASAKDDWSSFYIVNASAGPGPIELPYFNRSVAMYEAIISNVGLVPQRTRVEALESDAKQFREDDVLMIWGSRAK